VSRRDDRVLPLDTWLRFEERMLSRFSTKRANEGLAKVCRWPGWVWPKEQAIIDAVRSYSRAGFVRRRDTAAAELLGMRSLPRITPADELARLLERRRFGLNVQVVLPEDRRLSEFHALAIVHPRGVPMTRLVCRHLGGHVMPPFEELQRQAEARDDEQAVRLIQVEDARLSSIGEDTQRGLCFAAVRF
jgi:hypothetical protein